MSRRCYRARHFLQHPRQQLQLQISCKSTDYNFDLVAIPSHILDKRRSTAGQPIADIRLVDGSKDPRSSASEPPNATMPITVFFKNDVEFASLEGNVGRSPILLMALSGNVHNNKEVKFATIKKMCPGGGLPAVQNMKPWPLKLRRFVAQTLPQQM